MPAVTGHLRLAIEQGIWPAGGNRVKSRRSAISSLPGWLCAWCLPGSPQGGNCPGRAADTPAADARQLQFLRDGGSPNLGRTAGSKRVIAETRVPDRVRTISPTV